MDTSNTTTRICKTCKEPYPLTLEYFPPCGKSPSGEQWFRLQCRECWRKRERDYHATPEAIEAKRQSRKRRDPEKVAAEKSRSQKKHRDSANRRSQKYVERKLADNPNFLKELYQKNKPDLIKRATDWNKEHAEQFNARQRVRRQTNPRVKMVEAASRHTRRARNKNAEGTYTDSDIQRLFDEQEGRCCYCGITLFWSIPYDIHIDHIQPLARGGTNYPDNLALSCADCNLSKGDKTLEEWLMTREW